MGNDLGWLASPFERYHLQRCEYEYLYLITRPPKNILLIKSGSLIQLYGCYVLNKSQSSLRSREKWLLSMGYRAWATIIFDHMSFRKKIPSSLRFRIAGRAGHGPPQGGVSASKKRSPTPSLHTIVQNQNNVRSLLAQFFAMTQRVILGQPRLEQYIDPFSAQTSPILPSGEEDGRRTLAGDATSSLGTDSEAGGSRLSRLFSINRR